MIAHSDFFEIRHWQFVYQVKQHLNESIICSQCFCTFLSLLINCLARTLCRYKYMQSIYFLSGPCFFYECNKSQNICFTNYYSSLIYTSSHSLLGLKYPMSVGKDSFTTKIIITAFKKTIRMYSFANDLRVQFMNIAF